MKSSAPQPPDPTQTINAQAAANRINIETPSGNQMYGKYVANDKPAEVTDADWNAKGFSDRYRFEVDPSHAVMQIQESPEVAAYRQKMTAVAQALGGRAESLVAGMPSSPLRFSNGFSGAGPGDPGVYLPGGSPRPAGPPAGAGGPAPRMGDAPVDLARMGLPSGFDMKGGLPRTGGVDPMPPGFAAGSRSADPNPSRLPTQTSWNGLPSFSGALNLSGAPSSTYGVDGTVRNAMAKNPRADSSSAIRSDVDRMIAERPDAVTSVSRNGLPQLMSGVDTSTMGGFTRGVETSGLPNMNANVDRSGLGDYERINFNGLPKLAGVDDYSADRDKVSGDVFARAKSLMDPDVQQQRRKLEQRLADQGIPVGSEAWTSAVGNFERGTGETLSRLAMDATTAGGAEQSRLAGLSGAARSQLFGERSTDVNAANSARAARFGENLSDATLGNSARGQGFQEGVTNAGLNNDVRKTLFGEGATNVGLNNQARGQGFQENLTDANLSNDARMKALSDALAMGGFRAGLQNQDFTQGMAETDLFNRAREQQLGENAGLRSAYISELSGNADRNNAARVQGINEQLTERQNQFNELAALLGGPQVSGAPMMTPTPIDVAGPINAQYQGQLANWQASQARTNSLLGAGAGLAGAFLGRR